MSDQNVIGPLTILGDPEVGNKLLIRDNAVKDPDGIEESSKMYAWYLNGKIIDGQTSQQLIVTEDMQGKTIAASLMFKDRRGNIELVKTSERSEKQVPYSDERLKTLHVLYTYLLKREPDFEGLKFWANYLRKLEAESNPLSLAIVIRAFMSSQAYKDERSRR